MRYLIRFYVCCSCCIWWFFHLRSSVKQIFATVIKIIPQLLLVIESIRWNVVLTVTNLSPNSTFTANVECALQVVFLPTTKGFTVVSHGLYHGNWIMSIEVLSLKRWIRKWLSFAPITLELPIKKQCMAGQLDFYWLNKFDESLWSWPFCSIKLEVRALKHRNDKSRQNIQDFKTTDEKRGYVFISSYTLILVK